MNAHTRLPADVYERIVETAVSPFCLVDLDGTVRWVGASLAELLGYEPSEIVGTNVLDFVHPTSHALVIESMGAAIEYFATPGSPRWSSGGLLVNLVRADGSTVHCDVGAATPARTGLEHVVVQIRRAGTVPALHAAVAAMAHGRDLDVVLRELAVVLEQDLADTAVEIAHGWDGKRFSRVSSGSVALLGRAGSDATGSAWAVALDRGDVVVEDDLEQLPSEIRTAALAEGVTAVGVHPVRIRVGESCRAVVVVWRRSPEGFTAFSRQTLEQAGDLVALALQWHEGREALQWAAEHDPLTGLANRRAFVQRLEDATGAASAVLYIDLDDFKPVNENHGHRFGDKVLAVVGERLRGCVRPRDVVARIGGDEFAVLCPGLSDRAAIEELVVRLGDAVGRPIMVEGRTVRVGASVGVASTHGGSDVDTILEAADLRLREAKAARKRTFR